MKRNNFSGVIWVTGLPGAGKTTFAKQIKKQLESLSTQVTLLDGDELRVIMSNYDYQNTSRYQLAFSYAKLCHALAKQNNLIICATVSMFDDVRRWSRQYNDNYCEVFLSVSSDILQKRDQKGLYSSTNKGDSMLLPGKSQKVELPTNSEFVIKDMPLKDMTIQVRSVVNEVMSWK